MKVQLIARSFNEDAYLNFFLHYYCSLGFDKILILKCDDINFSLNNDFKKYKTNIDIKMIPNEGDNIYRNKKYYQYFKDKNYEWTFLVDIDEFLIFNIDDNKTIHDYINNIISKYPECKCIKLKWVCINKLNNKWFISKDNNDELMNSNNISRISDLYTSNKFSIINYLLQNELEYYEYIKSIYKTSELNNSNEIGPHKIKIRPGPYIVLDNTIKKKNSHRYDFSTPDINYCNGFIIHFNVRSLKNSFCKSLQTNLRFKRQIRDLQDLKEFINNLDDINKHNKHELKQKILFHMNQKGYFPNKIKSYHELNKSKVNIELLNQQIKTIFKNIELCETINFIDIEKENEILKRICDQKDINFNKLNQLFEYID